MLLTIKILLKPTRGTEVTLHGLSFVIMMVQTAGWRE